MHQWRTSAQYSFVTRNVALRAVNDTYTSTYTFFLNDHCFKYLFINLKNGTCIYLQKSISCTEIWFKNAEVTLSGMEGNFSLSISWHKSPEA